MRPWILAAGVLACLAMSAAVAQREGPTEGAHSQGVDAQGMPAGPGRRIAEQACQSCHDLDTVEGKHGTKADWTQTVNVMISHGAEVSDKDIPVLIEYLTKSFPSNPAAPAK